MRLPGEQISQLLHEAPLGYPGPTGGSRPAGVRVGRLRVRLAGAGCGCGSAGYGYFVP